MKIVSRYQSLKHYQWGDGCDGWNMVDEQTLSVKLEKMPSGTAEALHYHEHARQFFFILKGEAQFEIEGELITVPEQHGIQIEPGQKHRIVNNTSEALEFILSSQPSTVNDRVNV
ncbi:MAG: cupin domain-containing protein [Chitinophagaceae bacterium]|nr:cupin domain-containing protein [Chitinophagaceae bacterium]